MKPEDVVGKYVAYDSPQGSGFCWAKIKGIFRQPQENGSMKEFLLVDGVTIGEFVKAATVEVGKKGREEIVTIGDKGHVQTRYIRGDRLLHWSRLENEGFFFTGDEFKSQDVADEIYLAFLGVKGKVPIRAIKAGIGEENISEANRQAIKELLGEQEDL